MTITTFTLGTGDAEKTFFSYASVEEADVYMDTDPVRGPAWAELDSKSKESRLITATRLIDSHPLSGTSRGQAIVKGTLDIVPTHFPLEGFTVPPDEIVEATIILAANPLPVSAPATERQTVKKEKIGDLETEYFAGTNQIPLITEDPYLTSLLRPYLDQQSGTYCVESSGFGEDEGLGFSRTSGQF